MCFCWLCGLLSLAFLLAYVREISSACWGSRWRCVCVCVRDWTGNMMNNGTDVERARFLSLSRPCAHPFIVSFPRCCISHSLFFHFYVRPSFLLSCSPLLPFSFDFPLLSCSSFHVSSLFPSVLLCRLMLSLKRASFARALVTWCKIESRRRKGCINFSKSFRSPSIPRKAVSLLPFSLLLSVWFT